jgi:hypothetical protein
MKRKLKSRRKNEFFLFVNEFYVNWRGFLERGNVVLEGDF